MKNKSIELVFDRYCKDWQLSFLRFIFKLVGFKLHGSSGGDTQKWSEYYINYED